MHDLGYLGKPNMDGPEGERHVELGAALMGRLFGPKWHDFCLYHSRFYAKKAGQRVSKLCIADKMSIVITPRWLYLPMVRATGEVAEYMAREHAREGGKYQSMCGPPGSIDEWYTNMVEYVRKWIEEHRDGREDTWTPGDPSVYIDTTEED